MFSKIYIIETFLRLDDEATTFLLYIMYNHTLLCLSLCLLTPYLGRVAWQWWTGVGRWWPGTRTPRCPPRPRSSPAGSTPAHITHTVTHLLSQTFTHCQKDIQQITHCCHYEQKNAYYMYIGSQFIQRVQRRCKNE